MPPKKCPLYVSENITPDGITQKELLSALLEVEVLCMLHAIHENHCNLLDEFLGPFIPVAVVGK